MRWLAFAVLCALGLILQSTVAPRVEIGGFRPDWLLVLVVFYALHAPAREAVIGAWIIGLCADLLTVERLGLLSLSYAVAAYGVTLVREALFRLEAVTQLTVTFLAALALQLAWMAYRGVLYPSGRQGLLAAGVEAFFVAAYTAACAPPLHRALLAMAPRLRVAPSQYNFTGRL